MKVNILGERGLESVEVSLDESIVNRLYEIKHWDEASDIVLTTWDEDVINEVEEMCKESGFTCKRVKLWNDILGLVIEKCVYNTRFNYTEPKEVSTKKVDMPK